MPHLPATLPATARPPAHAGARFVPLLPELGELLAEDVQPEDVQRALDWIRAKGIPFRLQRAPEPFNIWQMFFPGPNGEEVELDFAPEEAPPVGWEGTPIIKAA